MRLARAYISVGNYRDQEQPRLSFYTWRLCARAQGNPTNVVLLFNLPHAPWADVRRAMDEACSHKRPSTPPRTVKKRLEVAAEAIRMAEWLGWTLTPDELELLERVKNDQTPDLTYVPRNEREAATA